MEFNSTSQLVTPEQREDSQKIDNSLQVKLVNKVKTTMKENVHGALYGDTKESFIAFNHKKEVLKLNPAVHGFMLNYQRRIVNLTNYHRATMIEQLNEVPSINYLLGKVESINQKSNFVNENIIM